MFRHILRLAVAFSMAALCVVSSVAYAQGFWGIGVGYASFNSSEGVPAGLELDDTGYGGKLFLGYQINPYVGVEGQVVHQAGYKVSSAGSEVDIDSTSGVLDLILGVPVADGQGNIYGKVGYHFWDVSSVDQRGGILVPISEDGNDLMYGLGFRIGKVRVEWERYEFGFDGGVDDDSDLFSISYVGMFGK